MKRTNRVLSALLALLMVVAGLAFPVAAEDAVTASATAVEGFDILVTDSETLSGWQSFESEGLPAKQLVAMDGHGNVVSLTHSGMLYANGGWSHPNGSGVKPTNGVKLSYTPSAPINISGMNYFVFDLYVSHPDKIQDQKFYVELSSSGRSDVEENSITTTLAEMNGGDIMVGWNRIYLSLDSLSKATGADTSRLPMDETQWDFFRIYNHTAFDAGEEFVLAIDNIGFAMDIYEPDVEEFVTEFTVFDASEELYRVSGGSGSPNSHSGRFNDKTNKTVYAYSIEHLNQVERVIWSAEFNNQLSVEVSLDGTNYEPVFFWNCDLDELITSGDTHTNTAYRGWQMKGMTTRMLYFNLTEYVKANATETSEKLYIRLGDSYPYAIIKSEDGTYSEDRAGSSGINCGSGGMILKRTPVQLSVSYPWGVIVPTVTESISFTPASTTKDDLPYLFYDSSPNRRKEGDQHYADGTGCFIYAYPVQNLQNALSVTWSAKTSNQLRIDVSVDNVNWVKVYSFADEKTPQQMYEANQQLWLGTAIRTYDMTAAVLSVATAASDTLYLRISDAYPYAIEKKDNGDGTFSYVAGSNTSGFGGNLKASAPAVFTVEYPVNNGAIDKTREESVRYRFLPTTSTQYTGATNKNIGALTSASESPYIVANQYLSNEIPSLVANGSYYYCDRYAYVLYAFPLEKNAVVTSASFMAQMGAEMMIEVSDSPSGPWYRAEIRTPEEIANQTAADAYLGDLVRTVDLTAAAKQIGTFKSDTLYLRLSDSVKNTGNGARIWKKTAAEFSCSYTVTERASLQTVVGAGKNILFTPTTASQATGTGSSSVIGTVASGSEYPYLVSDRADALKAAMLSADGTFYFCDETAYLLYAFPIEDGLQLATASFKAKLGAELSIAVSDSPNGPWREVEVRTADEIASGTAVTDKLADKERTIDLTSAVRQIGSFKNDLVYVRIADSNPLDGNGGRIANTAATFTYTYFWHSELMENEDALKFKGGSLSLTNDFAITYTINAPDAYTDVELRVGFANESARIRTPRLVDGVLTYTVDDIPAQRLGDEIVTTLIANYNGRPAIVHKRYSVREYCENMLNKSNDATLCTLLSDVLAYGAAAQCYANYQTDDLATDVNATLTPSTFDLNLVNGERAISGTASAVADWKSASLTLDTAMTLNMTFSAPGSIKNLTVAVQVGDRIQDVLSEIVPLGNGLYRVSYELYSYEFSDTLTASFLVDGVATGRTLTYSVGGYIKSTYPSAYGARKTLLEAIANYGCSVNAYVDENPSLAGAVRNEENMISTPKTAYVSAAEYSRAVAYNNDNTNLTLLQNVMNRAKAGENITVATIGGSITQGSSSSNNATKSYSALFRDWWITTFPESEITHVNAGIGATTSHLGVHRLDEHVLEKNPDVCIVEFSVNDYADDFYAETYESIVAKLLDRGVAVILQFMVKQDGSSTQEINVEIGKKYNLPMLSYGDAIYPTILSGERVWNDDNSGRPFISPDNIHPNDYGHAYMGEILWKFLNSVYAYTPNEVTVVGYDSAALKAAAEYYNADLLGPIDVYDTTALTPTTWGMFEVDEDMVKSTFKGAWVANPENAADGYKIVFENVTFSKLGILYTRTVDGLSGICEVYIDGVKITELDGDFSGGWGDYQASAEIYSSDEAATHKVTLKMKDTSKKFIVVRLLVAE